MLGDTMLPVALPAGLLSYGYSAGDIGLVMAGILVGFTSPATVFAVHASTYLTSACA